jgi:hypothetical protein
MDSLSVENLQALIIIAFDDVSPLALYFPFHRLIVGTDR